MLLRPNVGTLADVATTSTAVPAVALWIGAAAIVVATSEPRLPVRPYFTDLFWERLGDILAWLPATELVELSFNISISISFFSWSILIWIFAASSSLIASKRS
jgi:hypothetical protein